MQLEELIMSLSALPSVSGRERDALPGLTALIGPNFDEQYTDAAGNCVFVKRSGKPNARSILIDTHLDEIGMMVTEVCDGGFLRVTNLGGLDARTLQASEVMILGKKTAYAVVAAKPPHLSTKEERAKLETVNELYIDTGYAKEQAEALFPVGTPVKYKPSYHKLLNGRIAGTSFDDKACGACAAYALSDIPAEQLAGDVYLLFSQREESSRESFGAGTGAFGIDPDYAIAVDVDLGTAPDTPKYETIDVGKGISIAASVSMNRAYTKALMALCGEKNIPYQPLAASLSTGTNGEGIRLTSAGIPTAVIGLPLQNMHTQNEIISMDDAETLVKFIRAFVSSEKLGEVFGR